MQVNIRTRHLDEQSSKLAPYAEDKIASLDHYLAEVREADVELAIDPSGREGNNHVAEALLKAGRHTFRASAAGSHMQEAIDLLTDKLKAQLIKYHEKSRKHRGPHSE